MIIYRNIKDNKLYILYKIFPIRHTGYRYERKNFRTGEYEIIPSSQLKFYIPSYEY